MTMTVCGTLRNNFVTVCLSFLAEHKLFYCQKHELPEFETVKIVCQDVK